VPAGSPARRIADAERGGGRVYRRIGRWQVQVHCEARRRRRRQVRLVDLQRAQRTDGVAAANLGAVAHDQRPGVVGQKTFGVELKRAVTALAENLRDRASYRAESDERNKRTPSAARPAENTATNLDRLIHERTRLAIVSALAVNESLTFNELKELLRATDGNLSVHARKLEDAGYLGCTKSFDGRMPKTEYRLTSAGRRALEKYLNHMEALIRVTREG